MESAVESSNLSVMKNRFGFAVPLTKEEILNEQKRRENAEHDLGDLLMKNQGYVSRSFNANAVETPEINGYKILKSTPIRDKRDEETER